MTKEFYQIFLNYLSEKELIRLYSNLRKRNFSVKGFLKKRPPIELLAPQLAKKEHILLDVLEEFYQSDFDNRESATQAFSPDSAIKCLSFFVKNKIDDEKFLLSLIETRETKPVEQEHSLGKNKVAKKEEGFREKYLSEHRELLKLKSDFKKIQEENKNLELALCKKEDALGVAEDKIQYLQNLFENTSATIESLKKRINELEKIKNKEQQQKPSILIITDKTQYISPHIHILTYENISELDEIAENFPEIWFVENDLPFPTKRKLKKREDIRKKLRSFSTKRKMLEYAEQRREK